MSGKSTGTKVFFFILAGVVILGGFVAFGYMLYSGIRGLTHELTRIQAPSDQTVDLRRSGTYTVFLETQTVIDGTIVRTPGLVNGLFIRVEPPDGATIPVEASRSNSTYNFGGRSGVSLAEFTIEEPGKYRIVTGFVKKPPSHPVVLTLIQGFMRRLFGVILNSSAVLMASIFAAVIIVVLTVVRGRDDRKKPSPGRPAPIG